MAVFNPTVDPTRARDYRESQDVKPTAVIHPIGQEANTILPTGIRHVDISRQLEYTGAGDLVTGIAKTAALGAHAADEIVKDHISNELFTRMNNEREEYTNQLRAVRVAAGTRGTGGSAVLDDTTNPEDITQNEDVMSARAEAKVDPPAEVQAVPEKLNQLTAARGAGKISPTEYIARQNAILKDVRWNWSGWREYVDREASQIIGGNPANMYIRSMLHDINAAATVGKADNFQLHADITEARNNAGLISPELRAKVEANVPGAAAEMKRIIAPHQANLSALAVRKAELEAEGGNEQAVAFKQRKVADTAINGIIQRNFNVNTLTGGGTTTAKKVEDWVTGVNAGTISAPTEVEARAINSRFLALEAQARKEAYEEGDKKRPNGRTYAESFPDGSIGYQKLVESRIAAVFGPVKEALQNKDYGAIVNVAKMVEAQNNDMHAAIYDSSIGTQMKLSAAIIKMGGPNNVFGRLINVESIAASGGNVSDLGAAFANDAKKRAIVQPDLTEKGITHTLNNSIEKAIAAGEAGKLPDAPQTVQELVRVVDKIPDKNYPDEAKANIIRYTFGGDANKLLTNFRTEGSVDPVTGKPVKDGKFSMFERLAKPDIAKEVARLDKNNPELGLLQMYNDSIQTWAAKDLLGTTIQDLNKDATTFKYIHLTYNSEAKPGQDVIKAEPYTPAELKTMGIGPRGMVGYEAEAANQRAIASVALLNRGLKALHGTAEATGQDPNRYLFNFLINSGYSLEGPIRGFPDALLRSVYSSRQSVLDEQERLRDKYRTDNERRPPAIGE